MGKGFPGKDAKFQGQVRLDSLLPAEWIYAERIHPFGGQNSNPLFPSQRI